MATETNTKHNPRSLPGPLQLPSNGNSHGVPHTCYDDVDPISYLGPQGREAFITNKQGLRLKTYIWPASKPKCVVVFVHGHGAHLHFEIMKYNTPGQPGVYEGSWVEAFNAAGVSVVGIDNQGCGRSEGLDGLRFYIDSFQDYVDDVIELSRSLANEGQGIANLPLFIIGISLGGCIAFNAALQAPDLYKGVVLLAPMLSLERVSRKGLNPYLRPLANILSYIAPSAAIVATDRNVKYPEIQKAWDMDPLVQHGNTRVRNANEYMKICERVMTELDQVTFPFIVFHSENDTMCDCDGSKQLYLSAASEDKQLRLVNQMWHVLVKEQGHEIVRDTITEWMLKRAA